MHEVFQFLSNKEQKYTNGCSSSQKRGITAKFILIIFKVNATDHAVENKWIVIVIKKVFIYMCMTICMS